MKLTLEIQMDNAAFDGDGAAHDEAARILRKAADVIESGGWAQVLMDINGNKVGRVDVREVAA